MFDSGVLLLVGVGKTNTKEIAEKPWTSPKGKFGGASNEISVAFGCKPQSKDLNERHPFDIEICRVPRAKAPGLIIRIALNGSSTHVISGKGTVRHTDGTT